MTRASHKICFLWRIVFHAGVLLRVACAYGTQYCVPQNGTHNKRPFFCVFSAFNSLNDKIYINRNKVAEKYLRIAFSAIVEYCCVSYHGVPPPEAQPTAHPTHPQNFYFLFFQHYPLWDCFCIFFIVAVVHRCLFW